MTYFLIALQTVIIFALLAFYHVQSRDWREERAHLLHAAMARSLPELQAFAPSTPTPRFTLPDDDEITVGM